MSVELINQSPRAHAVRTIRQWIGDGTIDSASPLPTERDLCARLEVGRETCRRALQVLEREGLVYSAGPRTRMVRVQSDRTAPAASVGNGLMRRTVVVTSNIRRPIAGHQRGGWSDHIPYGVFEALQSRSVHAMQVLPEQLTETDLKELLDARPQGLAVVGPIGGPLGTTEFMRRVQQAGVAVAAYGDSPDLAAYDRVISDHHAGAAELTRFLLERGCRNMVSLGRWDRNYYWVRDRLAGHDSEVRAAGLTPHQPIDLVDFDGAKDVEGRLEALSRLIVGYLAPALAQGPIDGILAASDGIVPAIARACRILGKTPNVDIAIVGYDNYWSDCLERAFEPTPPLATADKRNFEIGHELVSLLMDRAEGRLPVEPQLRKLPPRLVDVSADSSVD